MSRLEDIGGGRVLRGDRGQRLRADAETGFTKGRHAGTQPHSRGHTLTRDLFQKSLSHTFRPVKPCRAQLFVATVVLVAFRMAGISNSTHTGTHNGTALPLWNVGQTMGVACLLALLPCLACLARAACDCWTRTHLSRKVAPVEGPRLDPPATPALARRAKLATSVRTGLADRFATAKRAAASMRTRVSGLTLQASRHTHTHG